MKGISAMKKHIYRTKKINAIPLRQNSCRLKFLEKIKFEISDEKIYKVF
jgi:hypothetical protein